MSKTTAIVRVGTVVALLAGGPSPLRAQESGDAGKGLLVAQQVCAVCNAVKKGETRSPNPMSPTFTVVAAVPGMTAIALNAILQTAHRTMPNLMLPPDDQWNVVAYILSLK